MAQIPNFKNLSRNFLNLPFDPGNQFSLPYLWGTIGLAVDVERVNADADDLKILWDPRYPGKITMLVGVRYRLGIALEYLGVSVNRTNPKELEEARQPLLRQKPLVAAYLH